MNEIVIIIIDLVCHRIIIGVDNVIGVKVVISNNPLSSHIIEF